MEHSYYTLFSRESQQQYLAYACYNDSMEIKPNLWRRLRRWVAGNRTAFLLILGSLLLVVGGAVAWFVLLPATPVAMDNQRPKPLAQKFYSPLTGREVPDEATTKRQVTAVMIENSPDARPQSGLKEAGVVFEAVAEGGITRFIALYQEARPALLGPVRSLRPYYLEWTAPFAPAYAHVGGSQRALQTVRSGGYKDIDQFFNEAAYYRSDDRYAPHNVYTTSDRLDELNRSKGFTESRFEAWPRQAGQAAAAPTASSIDITISGPTYNPHYDYDPASNRYRRAQAGQPHLDRELGQIEADVVVVLKVAMSAGEEDGYREQIETSGGGQAIIFQNGGVVEGSWRKADAASQLRFYDASDQPLKLNPGQVWLSAVAQDNAVSWQ